MIQVASRRWSVCPCRPFNIGKELVSIAETTQLRSCEMLDFLYIHKNIERNTKKVIDNFYLASSVGKITMAGSLSMEEAVDILKKKILLKEGMGELSMLHC